MVPDPCRVMRAKFRLGRISAAPMPRFITGVFSARTLTPPPTAVGAAAICPYSHVTVDLSMHDDKAVEAPGTAGDDDIVLCGARPSVTSIESKGPRMTVTFTSAASEQKRLSNTGFKALVHFRTGS